MKKSSLFTLLVLLLVVILAASVLTAIGKDGDGSTLLPGLGSGTSDGTNDGTDDSDSGSGNQGNSGDTGTTCLHTGSTRTVSENYGSWCYHTDKKICLLCNAEIESKNVEHVIWSEGVCTDCGYKCAHASSLGGVHTYTKIDNDYHTYSVSCSYCGYSDSNRERHIVSNGQQLCTCDLGNTGNAGNTGNTDVSCSHVSTTTDYGKTSTNHTAITSCRLCNVVLKSETDVHKWSNGMCSTCNYSCSHSLETSFPSKSDTKHTIRVSCSICNVIWTDADSYHNMLNGKCTSCGYECACDMDSSGIRYEDFSDESYCGSRYICSHGTVVGEYSDAHSFVNGVCSNCGYKQCGHSNSWSARWESNNDETHTYRSTCSDCGFKIDGETGNHNFVSGVCTVCGYFSNETTNCQECTRADDVIDDYTWNGDSCYAEYHCVHGTTVAVEHVGTHTYGADNRCTRCGYMSGAAG